MKVAIDKQCLKKIKDLNEYEYVYIFEDDALEELLTLNLHCINKNNINFDVDINLTDSDIDCIKKANIKDKEWHNLPPLKRQKIAIITPNYNYEEWIEKCLKSILNQTYDNYEIIFIDDCSTDNSVKKAKKILRLPHKVIELKQKRLNGGARNEAYLHLSEDVDYVWYIDSDDWLADDKVLEDINKKLRNNPDVLFVGMKKTKDGKEKVSSEPDYKDKYEAMQGWSGSCSKVIKRELATRQECLFNEGTLQEDRNHHYKICIHMNTFENLKRPVYVWNRDNKKSTTAIRDKASWGTSAIRNYADVLQLYLTEKGKDRRVDEILESRVEKTKAEMINGGDRQL